MKTLKWTTFGNEFNQFVRRIWVNFQFIKFFGFEHVQWTLFIDKFLKIIHFMVSKVTTIPHFWSKPLQSSIFLQFLSIILFRDPLLNLHHCHLRLVFLQISRSLITELLFSSVLCCFLFCYKFVIFIIIITSCFSFFFFSLSSICSCFSIRLSMFVLLLLLLLLLSFFASNSCCTLQRYTYCCSSSYK